MGLFGQSVTPIDRRKLFTFQPAAGATTVSGTSLEGLTLNYVGASSLNLYIAGRKQPVQNFTATDGATITLAGGRVFGGGETVEIEVWGYRELLDPASYLKEESDLRYLTLTGNLAGLASTAIARNNLGLHVRPVALVAVSTPVATVDLAVPPDITVLRITGNYKYTAANGTLELRHSINNAASYETSYAVAYTGNSGTAVNNHGNVAEDGFRLTNSGDNAAIPSQFYAVMFLGSPGQRVTYTGNSGFYTAGGYAFTWSGYSSTAGRATNIRIYPSSGNIDTGSSFLVEGW